MFFTVAIGVHGLFPRIVEHGIHQSRLGDFLIDNIQEDEVAHVTIEEVRK